MSSKAIHRAAKSKAASIERMRQRYYRPGTRKRGIKILAEAASVASAQREILALRAEFQQVQAAILPVRSQFEPLKFAFSPPPGFQKVSASHSCAPSWRITKA